MMHSFWIYLLASCTFPPKPISIANTDFLFLFASIILLSQLSGVGMYSLEEASHSK